MKKIILSVVLAITLIAAFSPARAADEISKAEKRRLFQTGAKLWPVYCAQCHNARPGSEFAPHEWNQIMMHMRGLPNMPAEDARALLEYLKGGRD
jgi:mono/diheme cytochrome c family protein